MCIDNQSFIFIMNNPSFFGLTKHVEIDCDVVRGRVLVGLISTLLMAYMSLVDIFTGGLRMTF